MVQVFLGIWEQVHNPSFNNGEFATIRSQAGLNSYKISVKKRIERLLLADTGVRKLQGSKT